MEVEDAAGLGDSLPRRWPRRTYRACSEFVVHCTWLERISVCLGSFRLRLSARGRRLEAHGVLADLGLIDSEHLALGAACQADGERAHRTVPAHLAVRELEGHVVVGKALPIANARRAAALALLRCVLVWADLVCPLAPKRRGVALVAQRLEAPVGSIVHAQLLLEIVDLPLHLARRIGGLAMLLAQLLGLWRREVVKRARSLARCAVRLAAAKDGSRDATRDCAERSRKRPEDTAEDGRARAGTAGGRRSTAGAAACIRWQRLFRRRVLRRGFLW
mmetsp:Transcript_4162/g.10801  ORF Transcript_4162/g.10801 Transcript_4162/m.10801 type:complete len:276 (-) Transcript_4162:1020-1847(-)